MKMNLEKVRKICIRGGVLVAAVLVVIYAWEYKCALVRPITGCSSFCEDKVYIAAYAGGDPVAGHICRPWYYKWMGK